MTKENLDQNLKEKREKEKIDLFEKRVGELQKELGISDEDLDEWIVKKARDLGYVPNLDDSSVPF